MKNNGQKDEVSPRLMNAFFRFKRLHHKSPILGLKHSEARMLFVVKKNDISGNGVSISDISHYLGVTSPTVTQRINVLEEKGYVERTIDLDDRRSILVSLTPKGEQSIKEEQKAFYVLFNQLAEHLGREKSILLVELLSEAFDYLNKVMPDSYS